MLNLKGKQNISRNIPEFLSVDSKTQAESPQAAKKKKKKVTFCLLHKWKVQLIKLLRIIYMDVPESLLGYNVEEKLITCF